MTPKQFNDAALQLFGSVYACATPLGISLRQAQRYAAGDQVVAPPVAGELQLLLGNVATLKKRRKQLIEDIAFLQQPSIAITRGRMDITFAWIKQLQERLADIEGSLRDPGWNMVAQI